MKNRLLELMDQNEQVIERFNRADASAEELLAIVQEHLADYTMEELVRDVQELQEAKVAVDELELDLDQLEQVAGGSVVESFNALQDLINDQSAQ